MSARRVTIDLIVNDEAELLRAGIDKAIEGGNTEAEAREMLTNKDGSVNVNGCLLMLLDSNHLDGCSTEYSCVEDNPLPPMELCREPDDDLLYGPIPGASI